MEDYNYSFDLLRYAFMNFHVGIDKATEMIRESQQAVISKMIELEIKEDNETKKEINKHDKSYNKKEWKFFEYL